MRIIKFRIWDNHASRFITENESSLHCVSNWAICPFTGKITNYVGDLTGGEFVSPEENPSWYSKDGKFVDAPRYLIQQFTELTDKNGKEIYEGDITKGICLNDGESICVVGFDTFGIYYTKIDKYPCESYEDCAMIAQETNEVIGNIFENSELLN